MTTYVTGIEIAHSIDGQFTDAVEDGQPEFAVVKSDSLIEVLTFVGILFIGLLYAWRKNALEWT